MTILANLEQESPTGERRRSTRYRLRLATAGSTSSNPRAEVVIHDLSTTGLLIETRTELSNGERLEVDLPEWGSAEAEIVWNSGAFFGCRFSDPISSAAVSAARLRSAPRSAERAAADLVAVALDEVLALSAQVREITDRLDQTLQELGSRRS